MITDLRAVPLHMPRPRIDAPILMGGLAAFCVYLSMYAFRRPFAAAAYDNVTGWTSAIDFKVALVIAQVAGYALSKLVGIKLIAELDGGRRSAAILGLIGLSWIALVFFALAPGPWLKVVALFLNGLPLGLIWGLVFSYLEGRRTSELLGAILCASFIVSSGVTKSIASWLMAVGVSEWWMPATTGIVFVPLLLVSTLALARMPPPNPVDVAARTVRVPMYATQRHAFLRRYAPGLAMLVAAYVLLSALRDFRDNFAVELWRELGYGGASSMFTASELPIALIVLMALASLIRIRDNGRALAAMHAITAGGFFLIGVSTLLFQAGLLGPIGWMIVSGTGLYLAYTPFNAMLFDRLIAATRQAGTAGFLIYVADAAGYLGSVALVLFRNLFTGTLPWLQFFVTGALLTSAAGTLMTIGSAWYFSRTLKARPTSQVHVTTL